MRRRIANKRSDRRSERLRTCGFAAAVGLAGLLLTGCRSEMYEQPRYEPFEPSTFFEDGSSARPLVAGAIPRDDPRGARPPVPRMRFSPRAGLKASLSKRFPFQLIERSSSAGRSVFESTAPPATASSATAGA